ncbi:diacylglycerol kinase family lipid kinase [Candidatus Acetothermia bacterium]|nr:diacylglycerol kinase family lipid kinase [Candidatus Acetothermia bacterium]MBI3643434.1 diacylglycerol kinase family lipid kinase [Candidatus Acetothermia bacterium]
MKVNSEDKYLLIINPAAGRGRTQTLFPSIQKTLQNEQISFEICFTSKPRDATILARDGVSRGRTHIIAVGGDGTIHEVANGIIGTSATLCAIPTGSGNDFCKALQIPLNPKEAVHVLLRNCQRLVDVGKLGDRYFVNGFGMGLDGAVSMRFRKTRWLRGKAGYLLGSIYEALTYKSCGLQMTTPTGKRTGKVLMSGASNGPVQGGDFRVAPDAQLSDGLLDFHWITDMPPLRRLAQIPKVRKGTHLSLPEVLIEKSQWAEIEVPELIPAHMDGEPLILQAGAHRIEVVPKALRVICAST